jgi:hypothetical protein
MDEKILELCKNIAKHDSNLKNDETMYSSYKEYIVSMLRRATNSMTYEERFEYVAAASEKEDGSGNSNFSSTFGVESILSCGDQCDFYIHIRVGSLNFSREYESGEVFDFVDGIGTSENNVLIAEDKINGEWTLGIHNGECVVYKHFVDYVRSFDDGTRNKVVLNVTPKQKTILRGGCNLKTERDCDYLARCKQFLKYLRDCKDTKQVSIGAFPNKIIDRNDKSIVAEVDTFAYIADYGMSLVNKNITIDHVVMITGQGSGVGNIYILATLVGDT